MAEADYDGSSQAENRPDERMDDDFIPDDALPLCAKCLKPSDPLQYYCDSCYSYDAINPLTPYVAFANIPFNYGIFFTMWHKLCDRGETSISRRLIYLVLIISFIPMLALIGAGAILICRIPQAWLRNVILTILILALIALFTWHAYSPLRP